MRSESFVQHYGICFVIAKGVLVLAFLSCLNSLIPHKTQNTPDMSPFICSSGVGYVKAEMKLAQAFR